MKRTRIALALLAACIASTDGASAEDDDATETWRIVLYSDRTASPSTEFWDEADRNLRDRLAEVIRKREPEFDGERIKIAAMAGEQTQSPYAEFLARSPDLLPRHASAESGLWHLPYEWHLCFFARPFTEVTLDDGIQVIKVVQENLATTAKLRVRDSTFVSASAIEPCWDLTVLRAPYFRGPDLTLSLVLSDGTSVRCQTNVQQTLRSDVRSLIRVRRMSIDFHDSALATQVPKLLEDAITSIMYGRKLTESAREPILFLPTGALTARGAALDARYLFTFPDVPRDPPSPRKRPYFFSTRVEEPVTKEEIVRSSPWRYCEPVTRRRYAETTGKRAPEKAEVWLALRASEERDLGIVYVADVDGTLVAFHFFPDETQEAVSVDATTALRDLSPVAGIEWIKEKWDEAHLEAGSADAKPSPDGDERKEQ